MVEYQIYQATVRLRRGEGWEVKPEAEGVDGETFIFRAGWLIEDGMYEGEWAMLFEKGGPPETFFWVASGDLDVISEDPATTASTAAPRSAQ